VAMVFIKRMITGFVGSSVTVSNQIRPFRMPK